MKFTASTRALATALKSLSSIAKPDKTHAILGSVAIVAKDGVLTLSGMSLEKRKDIAIPCRVIEEGSTTINCAWLYAHISTRPEPDCEMSLAITQHPETKKDQHFITIKISRSVKKIQGLPVEEMPAAPQMEGSPVPLVLSAPFLIEALTKSLAQAATDGVREYLKAVTFVSRKGFLNIQASDGRRAIIFYTEIPFPKNQVCIIPRDSIPAIVALSDSGEVEFQISDNILSVSVENAKFTTKLLEANLQDFEKLFPPKEKIAIKVTASRQGLIREINNAETSTTEDSRSIAVTCKNEVVTIKANGREIGDVANDMDAKAGSGEISFACHPQYLRDALNAFEEEEITLQFLDAITPFVIKNDSVTAIVYPQRLA